MRLADKLGDVQVRESFYMAADMLQKAESEKGQAT